MTRTRVALAPAGRLQYAALPFRRRKADDKIEVTLLTSRETGRWVIPKGWPIRGAKPRTSAAREALEESGLLGRMTEDPIGAYYYYKRLRNGTKIRCKVEVFALEVRSRRKRWREKGERKVRWFELAEAVTAVQEPGLRRLLRNLDALLSSCTGGGRS